MRVSFPMRMRGTWLLPRPATKVTARPRLRASSGVMGGWLAVPRMPSVPNSRRPFVSSCFAAPVMGLLVVSWLLAAGRADGRRGRRGRRRDTGGDPDPRAALYPQQRVVHAQVHVLDHRRVRGLYGDGLGEGALHLGHPALGPGHADLRR